MRQLRHFIKTDKYSKDKYKWEYDLEHAANTGSWQCHGYDLEPDAECPVCKKRII